MVFEYIYTLWKLIKECYKSQFLTTVSWVRMRNLHFQYWGMTFTFTLEGICKPVDYTCIFSRLQSYHWLSRERGSEKLQHTYIMIYSFLLLNANQNKFQISSSQECWWIVCIWRNPNYHSISASAFVLVTFQCFCMTEWLWFDQTFSVRRMGRFWGHLHQIVSFH